MGIDLTFLAKVDGSRCGRATWLASVRLTVARQRRTFTGFAIDPALDARRSKLDHPGCRAPAPKTVGNEPPKRQTDYTQGLKPCQWRFIRF
jgi:hypothetical protein